MALANADPLHSGVNTYQSDMLLRDLTSAMPRNIRETFSSIGQFSGSHEAEDLARMANATMPTLRTYNSFGHLINDMDYHTAWHALQRKAVLAGLHASVWDSSVKPQQTLAHQVRSVGLYLSAGLELGHLGPSTNTHAALSLILSNPALNAQWAPKILSRRYDSTARDPMKKTGLNIGLALNERITFGALEKTVANASMVSEGLYRITGTKTFISAPMSDAFIVLARTGERLSCFLVPRILQDGNFNNLIIERLCGQFGLNSNPPADITFDNAFGFLLGDEGEGLRTILDAITLIRHDKTVMAAGSIRAMTAMAINWFRYNHAENRNMRQSLAKHDDDAMMHRILADMAIDAAAASALTMRVAKAYDLASSSPLDAAYARLITPAAKYWVGKTAPNIGGEAMECVGQGAYGVQTALVRHYKDCATSLGFDENSNAMAQDVLRVLNHGRDLFDAVVNNITSDLGAAGKRTRDVLQACMALCETDHGAVRILTEQLALAAAATELTRIGAGHIADTFVETRLGGTWRASYGMIDARFDAPRIVELLYPPNR